MAFVPYCPLGRGAFTGHIASTENLENQDFREFLARFEGEAFEHNSKLIDFIREKAATLSHYSAQLALAWLLHRGQVFSPFLEPSTLIIWRKIWEH